MLGVTETPITDTGQSIRIQPAPIVKDAVRFIETGCHILFTLVLYIFFIILRFWCMSVFCVLRLSPGNCVAGFFPDIFITMR